MTSRVATPPSSSDSTRGTRTRQQQQQQQQQQPLIQKHQPFPSSTSSFSIHNSTYSSGLLGPNDSTRISTFQAGTSAGSSSNSSISNFNFSGQYLHTQSSTSLEQRRTPRSYSLFDITTSSAHCIQPYGGTETQNGAASNGTVNNGTARASRGNLTRPLFLSPHQDQASDMNSLYTIDSSTPAVGASGDSDDESAAGDGVSYFGSTGQDYLLKQKRAYRSKIICWLDLMALILFTTLTVLRPSKPDEGGQAPGGGWTWEWNLIPWLLTFTTVVRILLMAFTARYSDGNYNTAVIFVCMVITLCIMFEVNTVIQHRIALTTTIIAQYVVSMILTQMHWINYSVHTPMSAAFAYTYDPILSEGITFSRESRYTGTHSHYRASTLRRGTSYGTMNSSPFNTVQELDEELDDDHDAFIKVNVDRRAPSTRQNFYIHDTGTEGEGEDDNANEDDSHANDDGDEAYQDEEQDMATLLAFQDARRQQVYAFSPTASSAIIPARSILSPQALPGDSNNNRTPLSWALQGQQSGSYASSYDMRMAAAGSPGAAVIAGGLTVGYTPRRRSQRSNMDLNGTGRRTWTGGHNIIYSGIFVEDSDEDGLDQYQGTGDDPTLLRDDSDNDDVNKKHNEEQMEFDDMIKAEIVDSVVDNPILNQQEVIVDEDQKVPDETTIADELDCQQTHLDGIVVDVDDVSMHKQHPYFKEPTVDEETENTAIDAPEGDSNKINIHEDHQHHLHGLSTLKVHISSHKDITAVICDEDNCSEHQFQEGPAAELEAAIGSGFKGGNIVQLDIKENSTSAVERTGDGINDFEEFSLPGTICDLPDPLLGISNGDDGIKVETQRPISNGEDRRHGGLHGKDHGSMELHLRERAEDTRLELETGRPMSSIDIAAGITHPGTSPVNGDRLNTAVAIDGEHNREEGGEHNKEEGGYRRIHIHERIERVTIEEGDEIIGGTNIQGATLRPGHTITSGTVVGGIVIVDDPTKVTTVIPTVPLPGQIPGQWVQIQDTDQSTGVITWGVADDIPPSIQGGVCLEPTLEPIVYIPPQRTAIVDIPQPHVITTTPQLGPAVAIEPRQIIIPPTQPVMLQPQPVIRQHPEPIVYSPPRRPVIIPPQFAPQPAPVFQPAPVVVARPPPPRAIIQPQPRAIIQPQPQIITPAAPAILAPQQPFIAPAPIIQPQYGTYETIVPGATGGIGGTHVGAGVGVMPLNRRYSVASIYGDDRSVVSVYDGDVRSVASIYDDRTVISINEFGNGAGVAPVGGVVERQAWMRGHPLPGIAYGQHNQLASAAHAPRAHDAYNRRQGQRPEGAMHIDMDVDRDFESDIYVRNRHVSAVGPGRISPPRYPPRYPPTPFDRQSEYSEPTFDNRYSSHTEDDMEVETTLKLAAAQHTATPSDSASTEISYQEIQLHMDIPAAANVPLQELAIETYFDTTKSQLKVREQQGQLLSEMALQLKRRQQQIQQNEQQQQMKQAQEHQMKEQKVQLLQNQAEEHQQAEELQQPQYLLSPPMSNQAMASPESPISSLSRSIQQQQQQLQSPPTLNFPKPPLSPPPVRLLANRGLSSPLKQAKRPPIVSQSPNQLHCAGHTKHDIHSVTFDDESQYETVILSTSAQNAENIMLQSRHRKKTSIETAATGMPIQQDDSLGLKARSLISESILKPGAGINNEALKSGNIERIGGAVIQQEAHGKPPLPGTATFKAKDGHTVAAAAATTRKPKRKQHIPPMSRNHLHPALLQEGVMACWNNEFGNALEIFKEHSMTYPRWSLASAEVHIVQQLIGGQLSEADSELMDALQHSEKVGSRILDRTKDFDASFMSYRSICSADTTLITANDNTLKQNYKWDCEMSYYDTLLYRSILQLTASSDAKGTFSFSDIKGGLRLGRAWKGYMRIKQEVEAAKERWQKLSALVAQSQSTIVQVDQDHKVRTTGEDDKRKERRLSKENRPSQLAKTTTMPISIPTVTNNASHSAGSKKGTPLSTSQPPEGGSRWSIFGKRSSWNHQSAASLSSSPVDGLADFQDAKERAAGSRFLASSPSSKGLANILREQTKAVEDIKTAVKVLEDVEDYLHYGIGLFYFIVSIVPKSMLPALRTMGLQSNHEQGLNNLEEVFKRKNGRAPFAALFLLISYLFLPRGMNDPSISLGRAGEIIEECLKTCPNGSSYLLMACHHARKTGNMIPSALNHITRGIQTCEAAGIPSINYRFELGLTFFIHQEFGKAADIFEILWKRFITTAPIGVSASGAGQGRRRKGRSSSIGHPSKNEAPVGSSPSPVSGSSYAQEEEEEDDFEMAPFCGLCLIASKVVLRLGQEGYFEYGREGFGHHNNNDNGPLSPISGLLFENNSESRPFFNMPGVSETSGFTTQFNYPRPGPDFDLLIAAQEVLVMMSDPELQAAATMKSASGGSIFEHSKSGSAQSIDTTGSISTTASQLLSSPPPTQTGKLNRFNKFAWNQCQKSLQRGRISPFLPLVILYLRRDLAYMKPVLLRKYRTTLETIWKTVQQTADADTQAIYLLLSAVVHRQLLPDDATFAYTALTDCLLLESSIESEKWVVPHCHYELGELLYKRLHLPQAALEQFQWIVKGPGKEARPTSIFYAPVSSNSNPRLSVFGGGFPSDTVTNIVESVAAQNAAAAGEGDSHSRYPSTASNQRLSQLFLSTSATGGASAILGSSPTHVPSSVTNPPNPITFYNSRYKKFEFSQALRQRSSVSIEQIQKEIDNGAGGSDSGCTPASRRASVSSTAPRDTDNSKPQSQGDNSRKRNSAQSIDLTDQNIAGSKSIKLSSEPPLSFESDGVPHEQLVVGDVVYTTSVQISQSTGTPNEVSTQAPFNQGWSSNTLPNILSDAQRKRGSQQYGLGKQQLRPPQSPSSTKHYPTTHS